MRENVPIILALCSILVKSYYAPNYGSIIRPSLGAFTKALLWKHGYEGYFPVQFQQTGSGIYEMEIHCIITYMTLLTS